MKDGSFKSFIKADRIARDKSYHFAQATYSEKLFQIPPDNLKSIKSHQDSWKSAKHIPIGSYDPERRKTSLCSRWLCRYFT